MKTDTPQLLCVSANPAVDRRLVVPRFATRSVNRASSATPAAGGKAAHVAYAAKALGAQVRWLAYLGGVEGEFCRAGVEAAGVTVLGIPIGGRTRTTLDILDESSGEVTEILEPGPSVTREEQAAFTAAFSEEITKRPMVVISGSLPSNSEPSFYRGLVQAARDAGCRVFLDTSGDALKHSLDAGPDLIKPNLQEAEAMLGRRISKVEEAVVAARELRGRGARIVALSMGSKGAVLVDEERALLGVASKVDARSTVGSGDSFLAGLAVGMAQEFDAEECLRWAVACGVANCLAANPGMISRSAVEGIAGKLEVRKVEL